MLKFSKSHVILLLLFILVVPLNSIGGVFTTLVIIEEFENGIKKEENSYITEGILDALWDHDDYIFFDMRVTQPFSLKDDEIDVVPFIRVAKESGADSILLIKIDYNVDENDSVFKIKADDYYYNLFSLNNLQSLRAGKNQLNINKSLDPQERNTFLKDIGIKILNEVYN